MINSSTLAGRLPLLLFLLAIAFQSKAVDRTFTGTGNWSTPANWVPAGVPGAADRALFDNTSVNCTLDVNATVAHFEFKNTYVGIFNQGAFTLTVTASAA